MNGCMAATLAARRNHSIAARHDGNATFASCGRSRRILAAMLRQLATTIAVETRGRGLVEITRTLQTWVGASGFATGLLTLFIRHTSASLVVQENAAPEVRDDLDRFMARLVPDGDPIFRHRDEGADDMPAHVRSALTATQLAIPVADGHLALGTWQGVYVWEHRTRPHRREIALHLLGE